MQQSHKKNKWHAVHFQGKFTQGDNQDGERDPNRVGKSRKHTEDAAVYVQELRVGLIGQSKWHLPHQENCCQNPPKIMTTTKHMTKLNYGRKSNNCVSTTCRGHQLQITMVASLNAVPFSLLAPSLSLNRWVRSQGKCEGKEEELRRGGKVNMLRSWKQAYD